MALIDAKELDEASLRSISSTWKKSIETLDEMGWIDKNEVTLDSKVYKEAPIPSLNKLTQENLNYSAKGLNGIFKKYFPTEAAAAPYNRNPQKIANKVYSNRMGNGTEASGDGYKFRGRGYIQLTGKDNYTAFGKSIGVDIPNNPDSVATTYALASAAWFFSKNGLHKIADEGASDVVVTKITKRVNGGTIGLPDRIKHFKEYYHLLA